MEFDLKHGTAILERTPDTLRALLSDLPAQWTHATDGPDSWSPFDVLGHLVHGERTDWIPRARLILAQQPDTTFAPFDRFAQFENSRGKTVADLLDEFAEVRRESLATLAGWQLTDAHLSLTGHHPAFGSVTLRQLISTWVAHDLGHTVQIARVMARQYRDAVGPWRAYLSVLSV